MEESENSPSVVCVKDKTTTKSETKNQVLESMKRFCEAKNADGLNQQQKFTGRTESEVGIIQFVDSSEGFTGITKHRWGDFIVHEIDLAGNVIMLTDTAIPVKKQKMEEEVTRPDWFPQDIWDKLVNLNAMEKSGDAANIPAGSLTKEQRTQYHATIKACFPSMVTNTSEADGVKVISVRKASAAPDKRNTFWRHKPWPKDRPKFLHFCLYKENLDTFVALSNLSMDLKLKSNKFAFAGTKDARAKTTQMVSVKQITAEKVHEAAKKFHKISVGNFTYKDSELKLGDLKGNQFDLVLRHAQGSKDVMSRRMTSFQSVGFINYYGMQRFGTTSSGTHEVGRAILRREWRVAVDLLLSGRENETGSIAEAHRAWRAERDPQRALSLLTGRQQRTTIEGRVLHTLTTVRATAYQEALDRLPSGTRQLYVHAYQSWLWNRLVSRRLAAHGLQLRPGDLVLAANQSDVGEEPAAEEPSAPVMDSGEQDGEPAGRGATRLPEVRALTEAGLGDHSIHDLVMPLPGWAVRYPENELAAWYTELLAEDRVQLTKELCDTMPQYSLAGAYRHVLARPGAVSWRVVHYSDPTRDLLASDVDRLRGVPVPADEPGAPFRALVLQFSLPASSYATMAVREITGTDSSLAAQMKLNEAYSAEMLRVRHQSANGRPSGERGRKTATGKQVASSPVVSEGQRPVVTGSDSVIKEDDRDVTKTCLISEERRTTDQAITDSAVDEAKVPEGTAEGAGEPTVPAQTAQGQKRSIEDGDSGGEKRLKAEEAV